MSVKVAVLDSAIYTQPPRCAVLVVKVALVNVPVLESRSTAPRLLAVLVKVTSVKTPVLPDTKDAAAPLYPLATVLLTKFESDTVSVLADTEKTPLYVPLFGERTVC